jgi:hypothetical protein
VPLDSELYNTTRIIRIKRDWMVKGDLAPTYANLYPEILDPLITEDDFRILIKKINDTLMDAFDPFTFRAWLDAVMGVATLWFWEDAGFTGVKKELAELERWIEDWNRNVGVKEAVKIIPLRRTGYLTVYTLLFLSLQGNNTDIRSSTYKYQTPISVPTVAHGRKHKKTIVPSKRRSSSNSTNNIYHTRLLLRYRLIRSRPL